MRNVQSLKDVYAAAANHNVDGVLAAFDPAIEWREADGHPYQPDGRAWVGVDAVRHEPVRQAQRRVGRLHGHARHVSRRR